MRKSLVGATLVAMTVAACGGGDSLEVVDPWGRTSPMNAEAGAFYMTIENGTDVEDRIVSATSERCTMVELHNSSMNDEGVMSMEPAPELFVVPSGGELVLEPNGLHVMCMGLTAPLVEGETVTLELEMEQAGTVTVEAAIEDR